MSNKLLSVIVPVYNVEKYLSQCLDSIINQTYKNLEIVCVNDGSTDGSLEILEEYKKKDNRIKIVCQENQGLAAARNTGLKHFTGELVTFLDSDDWLAPDFYEKLIERMDLDNSDIAVGETYYVYPDRIDKNDRANYYNFKSGKNIVETLEDKQDIIYACACWNKVYKARLITDNALNFPHGLFIEDVPFTFASTILANRISLVRGAVLYYRRQEESILAQAKDNRVPFDIFKIYDVCESLLDKIEIDANIKNEYKKILENFEIFNMSDWYYCTGEKYKEEFFGIMKNKFRTIKINDNKYILKKHKKIFKRVIKAKNKEKFEKLMKSSKTSILQQIFSVKNENTKKIIRILGFKIKLNNYKVIIRILEEINDDFKTRNENLKTENACLKTENACLKTENENLKNIGISISKLNEATKINLSTATLHKTVFPQFKQKHMGQDIVIVATGPSASKYKPIKNAIHIGVNRALEFENINFDYYFIQDYSGKTPEYISELNEYRKDKCIKFYGFTSEYDRTTNRVIPETDAIAANALRYRTAWVDIPNFEPEFVYDISTEPLACFGSIVFPALQFALWTYPRRIYLVGCDCSQNGYAYDDKDKNFLAVDLVLKGYNKFKDFVKRYYPDVEIISVNPVGLKGLFQDEYVM